MAPGPSDPIRRGPLNPLPTQVSPATTDEVPGRGTPTTSRVLPAPPPPTDAVEKSFRPRVPHVGKKPDAQPESPSETARRPVEWRMGRTAKALVSDIVRDLKNVNRSDIERIVRLPARKLERRDIALLTNRKVSKGTRDLVVSELLRNATALERRGQSDAAAVARKVAGKVPQDLDAFGAKMLWDLSQRLPIAEGNRVGSAKFVVPKVDTSGSNGEFREAIFKFDHPGVGITGYRAYFSTTPPNPDGTFTADHQFEMGLVPPDATGSHAWHFIDTNTLNSDLEYYVWITAHDNQAESAPSNVLHQQFMASKRGDLNADGVIDTADVDKLMQILLGQNDALATADINADGWVTQADVDALLAAIGQ